MKPTVFSEQWMKHLWEHRLYKPTSLCTADGEPVTVLFPGTPNYDSGPDFLDALVRIGRILFRGDIELHVHANEWTSHRHHLDPRYNSVILHVAFRAGTIPSLTASKRELPLLLLTPIVPFPQSSSLPLTTSRSEPSPLRCHPPSPCERQALFRRFSLLGLERMQKKVLRSEERLLDLALEMNSPDCHASPALWEQLLYEGIVEGLGYAKNRAPFRRLARTVTIADLRRIGLHDRDGIMAALFGAAGLLPSPRRISEVESRRYLWRLRHRWKDLRPTTCTSPLHETAWKFFRLRPANLPTARLASLVFLLPRLFRADCSAEILSLFRHSEESCTSRLFCIRNWFAFQPDDFWARHLYFGTPQHQRGIALGQHRIDDIIVNTLFPWLFLYARKLGQMEIEQNALLMYRTFPPLQRNKITCQVERLLTHYPLTTAQLHQGALEWVSRFCSQGRCSGCHFWHS